MQAITKDIVSHGTKHATELLKTLVEKLSDGYILEKSKAKDGSPKVTFKPEGSTGSSGGMPDPDDEDPHKEQKPKLLYEGASYHGKEKQGAKNSAPTRGQRALEDSFDLGSNTDRRVGYDFDNDEIIVFDKTLGNKYHGHVRSWEELEQKMKNVLQKNDIFDHRGRVKGS